MYNKEFTIKSVRILIMSALVSKTRVFIHNGNSVYIGYVYVCIYNRPDRLYNLNIRANKMLAEVKIYIYIIIDEHYHDL